MKNGTSPHSLVNTNHLVRVSLAGIHTLSGKLRPPKKGNVEWGMTRTLTAHDPEGHTSSRS